MPSEFVQRQLDALGIKDIEQVFNRSKARSGRAKVKTEAPAKTIDPRVHPIEGGVVVDFPLRVSSLPNKRWHWAKRARHAKSQRKAAMLIPLDKLPGLPCVVTLTRVAPRLLDGDNLQAGFKALRDGIADRLGVTDADPRVTWEYQQEKGKPKQYGARVEIKKTRCQQ